MMQSLYASFTFTVFVFGLLFGVYILMIVLVVGRAGRINTRANSWMVALLLCLLSITVDDAYLTLNLYEHLPWLLGWTSLSLPLAAPVLWLMVSRLVDVDRRWRTKDDAWMFAYTPVYYFLTFPLLTATPEQADDYLRAIDGGFMTIYSWANLGAIIFGLVCLGFVVRKLIHHQTNIQRVRADVELVDLRWLLRSNLVFIPLLLIWMLEYLPWSKEVGQLDHAVHLIALIYFGFNALRQPEIYPYRTRDLTEIAAVIEQGPDVNGPPAAVPDPALLRLHEDLNAHMIHERAYLRQDLSLPDLSDALDVRPQVLSEVLNSHAGTNFYGYVNAFRVRHVCKLLDARSHDHLTLLAIAEEAGFRSKSTFNAAFKRETGRSPSQYRRERGQEDVRLGPDGRLGAE